MMAYVGIFYSIVELRTCESVSVFFSRGNISKKKLLGLSFSLDIMSSIIFILFIIYLSPIIFRFEVFSKLNEIDEILIYGLMINCSILLRGTFNGLSVYLEKVNFISGVLLTEEFGKFIIGLHIILNMNASIENLLLYYSVLSMTVTAVYSIFVLIKSKKYIDYGMKYELHSDEVSRYFKYVFSAFTATLIKALYQRVDVLIVSTYFGFNSVAALDLIKKCVFPLAFINAPMAALTFKKFVDIRSDRKLFKVFLKETMCKSLRLSIYYCLATLIFVYYLFKFFVLESSWSLFSQLVLYFGACVGTTMWWARNFSNLTSQVYSIFGNVIAAIYMIGIVGYAARSFNVEIFALILALNNLILFLYWYFIYKYEFR